MLAWRLTEGGEAIFRGTERNLCRIFRQVLKRGTAGYYYAYTISVADAKRLMQQRAAGLWDYTYLHQVVNINV